MAKKATTKSKGRKPKDTPARLAADMKKLRKDQDALIKKLGKI